MQREWSRPNSNLAVDQVRIYTGYKAVIASMTEEQGIGSYTIYPEALKAAEFITPKPQNPKTPKFINVFGYIQV